MKNQYALSEFTPDTMESFFGRIFIKDDLMIIPYINLGISNHELNPERDLKFIDRCYVVFEHMQFLRLNNSSILIDKDRNPESLHLGGVGLMAGNEIVDIEVKSSRAFLQLLPDSAVTSHQWIPVKGRNEPNMDARIVGPFMNGTNLPEDLVGLL